ncbi:thiamine-phosphate diphosphorylase [Polaribacter reichenbachii]|uniref:Thiamine-phosphate synthase n=1 Tax=Polaribacter reichenbachii TaxID=996801 RepID=A0A1B8U5B5_9FLAO|nr:thiamine phosphate synthase [Polaribacter reichenbachii]APZ47599.1 thiamine-phosphate diphosphorylase [Polaribacter reichenbachii]AUC18239.1 thiamine-phosphate diphosphorylase [Polaribacter reichenbachii]OBY67049.1 thiamine-phosphate diphosphorylase [Polaribacter reichenbachii]
MISKLHYITQGKTPEEHLLNLEKACIAGANWVQLRLKNMDVDVVLETAKKARAITSKYQTKLIINDYYKIAKAVNADGVHLGKKDECPLIARDFLGNSFIIGGTANTVKDCTVLLNKKVDYIGLGPYQFTKTKENLSPILGVAGYQKIINELQTKTPIIAIGGIRLEDVTAIINIGIYGIAVSGEITKDVTNVSKFQEILN